MITCDPNAIALASRCYCGFSAREADAAAIYSLCFWATHLEPEFPCGVPSDIIVISGAGSNEANGTYVHNPSLPNLWNSITDPQAYIRLFGGIAFLEYGLAAHQLYQTPISDFPCVWTVDLDGLAPAPTGMYQPGILWLPTTEIATWQDMNGIHVGDLTNFNSTADFTTVSSLVFGATGLVTSLSNIQLLTSLSNLDINTNAITSLDLTGCSSLATLNCSICTFLTTLTLTGCTALTTLDCSSCNLSALDVSGLANLDSFTCINNPNMTSFDASGATIIGNTSGILDLSTGMGSLVTVNLSSPIGASQVDCSNNQITTLDLTNCLGLTDLRCHDNQLTTLDVSDCLPLDYLECYNNSITSLDFSANLVMETLLCQGNSGLTALTIGNSPNYLTIDASGCALPDTPAGVNDCLVTLVAIGPIAGVGSVILNLGTNSAPTVGPPDGIAAKAALPGLGWITVLTN